MRPLKVRDLLPSFAMEMDRSVEEVQVVVAFYYKMLRQKLTSLDSVNVQVENLGTFYIKEKALYNQIDKLELYNNKLSDSDIKQYAIKLEVSKKIETMKTMGQLLLEEKQRRRDVINKRFNNELKV